MKRIPDVEKLETVEHPGSAVLSVLRSDPRLSLTNARVVTT